MGSKLAAAGLLHFSLQHCLRPSLRLRSPYASSSHHSCLAFPRTEQDRKETPAQFGMPHTSSTTWVVMVQKGKQHLSPADGSRCVLGTPPYFASITVRDTQILNWELLLEQREHIESVFRRQQVQKRVSWDENLLPLTPERCFLKVSSHFSGPWQKSHSQNNIHSSGAGIWG